MSISIVTPSYNSAKTIRQTLDALLQQSVLPKEHIIIDGSSNDATVAIAQAYKAAAPYEVKIISEKDSGIYDAMNKGIDLASGDIIGIINSDDWYEPTTLELVRNAYEKNGSGVYYGFQRYLEASKEQYIGRTHINSIATEMIQHPTCFVTRDIYEQYGVFNLKFKYSSDLEFIIRLVNHNVPFYPMDHVLTNFSLGGASSTRTALIESLEVRYGYGMLSKTEYYKKKMKLSLQKAFNL